MKFRKITYRRKRGDEIDITKVIERVLWQKDYERVIEGIIISHKTKNIKSNIEHDTQKHLIGYHYFKLQYGKRWHDIEGFWGNIINGRYTYFIYNTLAPMKQIPSNLSYHEAIKLFNERRNFDFLADELLNEINNRIIAEVI